MPLGAVRPGSVYDDVWQGGFEELFPSDDPTTVGGARYPDHGELWSAEWNIEEASDSSLKLSVVGAYTGVSVTKTMTIDGPELTMTYHLAHKGSEALPYLFKLHPAFSINEHCRIDLPGGRVEKVAGGFGNILDSREPQDWPTPEDLSQCRSVASVSNEFVYVSDLPEGWCGITDERIGSWIRISYPLEFLPYCWIFMSYGGWRSHNVVVLEPCTNYPKDIHEALSRGTSGLLEPEKAEEFSVFVRVGSAHDQ